MADAPDIKRTYTEDGKVVVEQKMTLNGQGSTKIEALPEDQDKPHVISANTNGRTASVLGSHITAPEIRGATNAPNVIYGGTQPIEYDRETVHLDSFATRIRPAHQSIQGGEKNDIIFADQMNGKDPSHALAEGSGKDFAGNDVPKVNKIIPNGDFNMIRGMGGDDIIIGGNHTDSIEGGYGADKIYGGEGNDSLDAGDDEFAAQSDNAVDYIDGGPGNDSISLNSDGDIGIGGEGDDILDAYTGNVIMDGGAGNDSFHGHEGANVTVILSSGKDEATLKGQNDTVRVNNVIPEGFVDGSLTITSGLKAESQYPDKGVLFEWKGRDANGQEHKIGETFVRGAENIIAKFANGQEASINLQELEAQPVTLTPQGVAPTNLTSKPPVNPAKGESPN